MAGLSSNFRIEKDEDEYDKDADGNEVMTIAKRRKALYEEAVTLANQRVPLRQIVQDLNRSLEEFYVLRKEEVSGLPKPKKITFENVQARVQQARVDAEIKKSKAKQTNN